ncbi:MAG: hypothetical protein ACFE9R_12630 [Candidatus Hermodarchaeota archaeon]
MELKTKRICIILFAIILVSSMIITPFIFVFFSINPKKATITFYPSSLKSFPNQTAWLIAEINILDTTILHNPLISVASNESISLDYTLWDNTPKNKVLEIFIVPNSTHLNHKIEIEARVSNNNTIIKNSAFVEIINWTQSNISEVIGMRDVFISHFSLNEPTFNINESTIWEGFDNAPQILIVEHYLFRSEFWEMELSRHVMIAPYDWVKVYLRPRNQIKPIWEGIITSWSSGNHTIIETDPPPMIYR